MPCEFPSCLDARGCGVKKSLRRAFYDSAEAFERDFIRASDGWLKLAAMMRQACGPDPRAEED